MAIGQHRDGLRVSIELEPGNGRGRIPRLDETRDFNAHAYDKQASDYPYSTRETGNLTKAVLDILDHDLSRGAVLSIYGIGGQGKSYFMNGLQTAVEKQLTKHLAHVPVISVDIETEATEERQFLRFISRRLIAQGVPCTSFLIRYYSQRMNEEGWLTKSLKDEIREDWEALREYEDGQNSPSCNSASEGRSQRKQTLPRSKIARPVIGAALRVFDSFKLLRLANKVFDVVTTVKDLDSLRLDIEMEEHIDEVLRKIGDSEGQPRHGSANQFDAEDNESLVPYLLSDLKDWTSQGESRRLIFFVDTLERIRATKKIGNIDTADYWLRQLTLAPNTLWIAQVAEVAYALPDDSQMIGRARLNLAEAYTQSYIVNDKEDDLQHAMQLERDLLEDIGSGKLEVDADLRMEVQIDLGLSHMRLGEFSEASRYLEPMGQEELAKELHNCTISDAKRMNSYGILRLRMASAYEVVHEDAETAELALAKSSKHEGMSSAKRAFERSLDVFGILQDLDPDSHEVRLARAKVLVNCGIANMELKFFDEAEEQYREARKIYSGEGYKPIDKEVIRCRTNQADLLFHRGVALRHEGLLAEAIARFSESRSLHEELYGKKLSVYGEKHRQTVRSHERADECRRQIEECERMLKGES